MLLIHVIQDWIPTIAHLPLWNLDPATLHFDWDSHFVLAQQFDTDVFAGFRRSINNFYRSGQLWAMIAGIVIGYIIRGFTTYG